jgi:conjugal transfer/entry exclusion protein
MNYKFREDELINEFKEYIDSTYQSHYASGSLQSTEVIIDRGRGMDFALGNVDKYNARYGIKEGRNRKDILKILHYALIALYVHDLEVE